MLSSNQMMRETNQRELKKKEMKREQISNEPHTKPKFNLQFSHILSNVTPQLNLQNIWSERKFVILKNFIFSLAPNQVEIWTMSNAALGVFKYFSLIQFTCNDSETLIKTGFNIYIGGTCFECRASSLLIWEK